MEAIIVGLIPEYQTLLANVERIKTPRKSTSASFQEFRTASAAATNHHVINFDAKRMVLFGESTVKLAIHAYDALVHESEYFEALIEVLSTTTRTTSLWRSQFAGFDPEFHQTHALSMRSSEPDCVLELARRVCTLHYQVSSAAIACALKIIANCCADDNSNRKLIVHREGIHTLIKLALCDADPAVLIPTLYNVCIDYDEPSVFLPPTSDRIGGMHSRDDLQLVTLSTEHLASACGSTTEFATFQLLLSLAAKMPSTRMTEVGYYLANLIEMSTQAALHGIENIFSYPTAKNSSWNWNFTINGKEYDSIRLAHEFSLNDAEIMICVSRAMFYVLSQQGTRDALFARDDDSIWTLSCLPNKTYGLNTTGEEHDELYASGSLLEEMSHLRQVYLKMLYEISGDPRFHRLGKNATSMLISISSKEIQHSAQDFKQQNESQHSAEVSVSSNGQTDIDKLAQTACLTMACVILSQLCTSEQHRAALLSERDIILDIVTLLEFETSSDVLYPALNLVSLLMSDPRSAQPLLSAGALQKMQRLLMARGLGLIVPRETVTAYKVFAWKQPTSLSILFTHNGNDTAIVEDVLRLWSLTGQADTKLEIGLFFLEALRGNVPSKEGNPFNTTDRAELHDLNRFLVVESARLTEIFTWLCLHAEPLSQRDHGWFLLAVLSLLPGARKAMLDAIDEQQELMNAVIRVSQMPSGSCPGNLKLILANLLAESTPYDASNVVKDTLRNAAANLNLIQGSNTIESTKEFQTDSG